MKTLLTLSLACQMLFVAASAAKPYKGAEYRTKASFLYGRFEVRMQAIGCEGALSSFFTYNDTYPSTPWNEIDIEILGRYTDDVQFNTITPGQVNHVSHQYVPFDPGLDYHVYGFEWTPTYVAWFVDSVEVYRQTGAHIATLDQPQKLMMNVWNPDAPNWVGKWNDRALPAFARYDWVRVASYTPGAGSVGTDRNFTPLWTDQFDAWDQTRWDKASHTWNGNNCDFVYNNAVFQNGNLILCLTKETAVGYVDTVPPFPLAARCEAGSVMIRFSEKVEKASAETPLNYSVTGAAVSNAKLLADCRTVKLDGTGLDTTTALTVTAQNVRDRWSVPNVLPPYSIPLIHATPLTFPVKINAGGSTYQDYLADREWGDSTDYGRLDGQTSYYQAVPIAGTADQEVYRSELFSLCEYKIRVPDGRYMVVLMMAENYFTAANKRKMAVVVEGVEVDTALDVYSRVGFRTAYQKAKIIDVTDGEISIHMQGLLDNPMLNGITITRLNTGFEEQAAPGGLKRDYTLFQNYPNPFNGSTVFTFEIPRDDRLTLKVYDSTGRSVLDKVIGQFLKGSGRVVWDGRGDNGFALPSGVYFYRIDGAERSGIGKLVLLK